MATKTLIKKAERQSIAQSAPAKQVVQNMTVAVPRIETTDVGTWRTAINSAFRGERTKLYALYDNLLADPVLADALDKLTDSVTNAEIMFQVDGESVDEIEDLMESLEFERLLKEIVLSFAWGKSVIECSFLPDFQAFSIPRRNIRITNLDKPLKDRKKFIALKESDRDGYDYTQDEFMIECGDDDNLGFLYRAALFVIYKRGGWGDWSQFVEKFAMPFLTAEYEGFDTSVRDALFEALALIGSNPYAAVPKGVKLEVHDNNTSGSNTTYDAFTDKCDRQILIALLGNTMTTLEGSSRAQSQTHMETQEARFKRIRKYVQRVLNFKFLPLLIKRGYKVDGGYFSFPDAGETISTRERLDMALDMKKADLAVDDDYIFEITGVAKAENTKEPDPEKKEEKKPEPEEKNTEETKDKEPETPKEKTVKNSGDHPSEELTEEKRNFLIRLWDFFSDAPTKWSGAAASLWTKSKRLITRKVTLDDGYTIDINKLINEAVREVYGNKGAELVNKNLFDITNKPMQQAIDTGLKDLVQENPEFVRQFKENAAVFAAFKNHKQTELFVAVLKDENGNIRSFSKFRKECLKIGEKFNNQYLQTEYNTLLRALRLTANLKQYEKTLHIYQNLEYVESNAAHPRESHLKYVGLVLPFHHPVWRWLMPPSKWNCDCSVRPTDKEVSKDIPVKPEGFDPIFDNRPDITARFVNTEETPYYKQTDEKLRDKVTAEAKRLLDESEEEPETYKGKNGGYLEIVKQNGNERVKNLETYRIMADNGEKYTLIEESNIEGVKNPDAFNFKTGMYSDAKHPVTDNGKNAIQNSISAANKQKVGEVVIRLTKDYPSKDLYAGLKVSLQPGRVDELKTIVLIRNGHKPIYLDVEKLQLRFSKK